MILYYFFIIIFFRILKRDSYKLVESQPWIPCLYFECYYYPFAEWRKRSAACKIKFSWLLRAITKKHIYLTNWSSLVTRCYLYWKCLLNCSVSPPSFTRVTWKKLQKKKKKKHVLLGHVNKEITSRLFSNFISYKAVLKKLKIEGIGQQRIWKS